MRLSGLVSVGALVLVLASCGDPIGRDGAGGAATLGSSIPGGDGSGSDAGETEDDAESATKLDVAHEATTGAGAGDGGQATGCQKVDLLFVIDDSISMDDEQAALIQAFPDFIAAMQAELSDAEGYNIGVVSTDVYAGDPSCAPLQRGTLITRTAGQAASNAQCDPYVSGKRYMTEQDDLAARFACAAQVGTAGDPDERPMESMLAALSPAQVGPGGCNDGFLRDDALLVVVIITDEEDDHEMGGCNALPGSGSIGEPFDWYEQLVAVKDDVESSVVVLSIVGPGAPPVCPALDKCVLGSTGAEVGARIATFTEMFTHGFVGSVCQPYGPQFQDAIAIIDSACDDFVPPG